VIASGWLAARIVAGLIAGGIAGSFVATILVRWPKGERVSSGRSRCDLCGEVISARHLVPVFSYVALAGRCAACKAPIDSRHPALEIAAALLGGLTFAMQPFELGLATALLGWLLLLLAALDLEFQWLPEKLTLTMLACGLATGAAGLGPPLASRLVGAAAGWVVLAGIAFIYRKLRGREGMGGGDPTLLAAIGAWLGWAALPLVIAAAGLTGLCSIALMRLRGEAVSPTTRLPLGSFLAIAAWPVWLVLVWR
jgi:leader peptidase (prepilin peptidase)/N-methyltransferase